MFTSFHHRRTILSITQGPYLSDHCIIIATLGILKTPVVRKEIQYRRLKSIDASSFGPTLFGMLQEIDLSMPLERIISQMESLMTTLLNVHAPVRKGKFSLRKPQVWFNLEIKRLKRTARKLEREWRKFPNEHTRNNYKEHTGLH